MDMRPCDAATKYLFANRTRFRNIFWHPFALSVLLNGHKYIMRVLCFNGGRADAAACDRRARLPEHRVLASAFSPAIHHHLSVIRIGISRGPSPRILSPSAFPPWRNNVAKRPRRVTRATGLARRQSPARHNSSSGLASSRTSLH